MFTGLARKDPMHPAWVRVLPPVALLMREEP
jgi:hypothetical protein